MSVKIKETIHKVNVDSLQLRLVQLTNDVYKMKRNDRGIEWEEKTKVHAIERFVRDVQHEVARQIKYRG